MAAKKAELLLLFHRPETSLHNNASENEIREFAKRRKISGSKRSVAGRQARDTFAALKKHAGNLVFLSGNFYGIVSQKNEISKLATIIFEKYTENFQMV
ncbi:MAG: hypothetical protein WCP32_16085 [Bacteroidota bacterium]